MTIKPLGERVLVKPIEVEEKTKSGIVLPDTVSKEKPTIGEIIAVGEEVENITKGDKVIYSKYSGSEIKDGDVKYLILKVEDVLAVVED